MKFKLTTGAALVIGFGLLGGWVQAAELVVTASSDEAFKPGQIVDGSQSLQLADGKSITLVAPGFDAIVINAPFDGMPDKLLPEAARGKKSDPELLSSLSDLYKPEPKTGKRAVYRAKGPKNPWDINIALPGDHCVNPKGAVKLWRPKPKKAVKVSVKNVKTKQRESFKWPARAKQMTWPTEVPVKNGATYLIRVKGASLSTKLRVHIVPTKFPTTTHQVVWMAKRGCRVQAKKLVNTRAKAN